MTYHPCPCGASVRTEYQPRHRGWWALVYKKHRPTTLTNQFLSPGNHTMAEYEEARRLNEPFYKGNCKYSGSQIGKAVRRKTS